LNCVVGKPEVLLENQRFYSYFVIGKSEILFLLRNGNYVIGKPEVLLENLWFYSYFVIPIS
jgi:hypothetical protein